MNASTSKFCGLLLSLCGMAAAQTTTAPATGPGPWSLDLGMNYVTGDYGLSQDTTVWVQTTAVTYEPGDWRFQATLPLVALSGPASIIGDVGRVDTSTERGMGDATLAATYKLTDAATGRSDVDLTARVKFPTADEDKGLGTGTTDAYLEANYHHTFGRVTPFVTAGYRFLGESAAYPLRNGFYTVLGAAAPLTDGVTGGLAVMWRQRIVDDAENATEAMAFVSQQINPRWRLQGYALTGFTEASPNLGLGALLGFKF